MEGWARLKNAAAELGATITYKLNEGIKKQSFTSTLWMIMALGLVIWIKIMRDDIVKKDKENREDKKIMNARITHLERKADQKDSNWNALFSKQFDLNNQLMLEVRTELRHKND